MYLPTHFAESRPEVLRELIRAHPLGALVTQTAGGLDANHIPFYFDGSAPGAGSLLCHVARANPVWREASGATALVIFQGPSAYITPSWYPAKREHGKVVPTWNYAVVHAHGTLHVHDDAAWVRRQIGLLTDQMEGRRAAPWSVNDAPADYVEKMAAGIVGIELVIERLTGKWKVSQNQTAANREGVVQGLESEDETGMAALVRRSR